MTYDETDRSQQFWLLHRDLLTLRRDDRTISLQGEHGLDGATLNDQALILRFGGEADEDRMLVVNLGPDVNLASRGEPLVAPPEGTCWQILWSSEDPAYGGSGTPVWTVNRWSVPGHAALLLGASSTARLEDDRGADGRG